MLNHRPARRPLTLVAVAVLAALTALASYAAAGTAAGDDRHRSGPDADAPLVIGHRGAPGYRPEHTLASYALAARLGTDYVEPDLVSTKNGVLVARHEPEISGTTDVAEHPQFADRRTTKSLDGADVTGWFTEDFTLAELKTLRAKERIPELRPRNTLYDGRYEIPTFQEVIDLTRRLSRELDRRIGLYPETKHPTYFKRQGLALERPLIKLLRRNGLDSPRAKVFVQSFEVANLRYLDRRLGVPLLELLDSPEVQPYDAVVRGDGITYGDLASDAGLDEVAGYADGIGPWKPYIVPRDASEGSLEPTDFVDRAHRAGLEVHAYTFRNENSFLPSELRSGTDPALYGDAFSEYEQFFRLGVDGVFSDNPDTAVEARAGLYN